MAAPVSASCLWPSSLLGTIAQKVPDIIGPLTSSSFFYTSLVTLDELIQLSEAVFPFVFQGLNSLILYTSQVFFFFFSFERERKEINGCIFPCKLFKAIWM